MCIVCEKGQNPDEYKGITKLYCQKCPQLTTIPNIQGLKELVCNYCINLSSIPMIHSLIYLSCSKCDSITYIPNLQNIQYLDCSGCSNLTKISLTQYLDNLWCYSCPQLVIIPYALKKVSRNCPWLSCSDGYHKRVRILKEEIETVMIPPLSTITSAYITG